MAFTCPECGTRQRGGQPGAIIACASCRNPIVVPEPQPRGVRQAPAPTPVYRETAQRLWGTATLVLLIVAAAHAGLYLLLTTDARSALRILEQEHGAAALRSAKRPEAAPQPGTAAYAAWRAEVERHDASKAWQTHRRHVALLRGGFIASFLVQVGITIWILLRLLARRKGRRPRAS